MNASAGNASPGTSVPAPSAPPACPAPASAAGAGSWRGSVATYDALYSVEAGRGWQQRQRHELEDGGGLQPGHQHAGAIGGIPCAVGGTNAPKGLATVEAYDPATNAWRAVTSLPSATAIPAVGVINNLLYAVGGYGTAGTDRLSALQVLSLSDRCAGPGLGLA